MELTIPHLQKELDKLWPGTRIEYTQSWGYWVITDYFFGPDAGAGTGIGQKTPWNMYSIEPYNHTNRKIVFVLSDPDTGLPVIPSSDRVIETMYAAYNGGKLKAINDCLDRCDATQEAEYQSDKAKQRDGMHDMASRAWDRHKGKVYSTTAGICETRKVDDFITAQMMNKTEADRYAEMLISQGKVSSVRRDPNRFRELPNR